MAIAFGIFAVVFAFATGLSAAGGEGDRRAAPYCAVFVVAFLVASVATAAVH